MAELRAFTDADGIDISYRSWLPEGNPRAIVEVAHGASEHSGRYARFAEFLTRRGYAAYAVDHRGHGATSAATGGGPRRAQGLGGHDRRPRPAGVPRPQRMR